MFSCNPADRELKFLTLVIEYARSGSSEDFGALRDLSATYRLVFKNNPSPSSRTQNLIELIECDGHHNDKIRRLATSILYLSPT